MFYVIAWAAAGACSVFVAGAKGRDPVRWLILGTFFGPLATMAACFMPAALVKGAAPARRICPHCSNELSPTARLCRWCKRLV